MYVSLYDEKLTGLTHMRRGICAPLSDRFAGIPSVLPSTLLTSARSLRKLQIINVGLRQIAERVAGIEDQRTKLSDHRVIEFRMIGQYYDQIH